ncbi:MAG TPA: glycosyltransferase family 2 protein [Lacibacter sp.]|nr:glycosyltransferase family 2 protein [Lacibacter sp.]HMO90262.1 glycosyltransferase family 2 protein [Lacibacter sp.]HMP87212.1 glycosyltransferase family 2 protein [Lacibacter sp.]
MAQRPFISICIPAYKNRLYLQRLLDSIAEQQFRDFEVVLTDDSPDEQLQELARQYEGRFPLRYLRNPQPLGSPANWNRGIALAAGEWIKIMHDDDWFTDAGSLRVFADAARTTKDDFIFSGFEEVDVEAGHRRVFAATSFDRRMLHRNPLYLLRTNYIGHPSTTLIRNNRADWFDETIKWVVDVEFYIRALRQRPGFMTLTLPLITIGVGREQITRQSFRKPEVEVPENLYLLQRIGLASLRYIFAYDYYWRLLRNLRLTSADGMSRWTDAGMIPEPLLGMMRFQRLVGQGLLRRLGIVSKCCMFLHYLLYAGRIQKASGSR